MDSTHDCSNVETWLEIALPLAGEGRLGYRMVGEWECWQLAGWIVAVQFLFENPDEKAAKRL